MEVSGKIVSFLEVQKGEGKNGEWQKQEFVIETTDSKFPKKICISVWGADKVENLTKYNKVDDKVKCSIEIDSREFNGKWFTNVQAWRIDKEDSAQVTETVTESSDLPF